MELLERDTQGEQLQHLLTEAAERRGRLLLLGGEAGAGKTVLVRRFALTGRRDVRTLIGACDPVSTPRPLGPLLDMADMLDGEVEPLLQANVAADRVFRAFRAELAAAASPSLIVLEDAQWADAATLDLIRFLGRRLDALPALLIVTYRDDEVGPRHPLRIVLGDLAPSPSVHRMTLPPLSPDAVGRLAQGSGLDPAELYRRTSGNPFFVTEVLASGAAGIPPTVRDTVLARAARLPPAGLSVLETAAVIGARIEPWLLEAVVPSLDAVDACLAGGMLSVDDDLFTFRHELARQAILETLSPHRAASLHRRVLDALQSRAVGETDPGRVARVAEMAGEQNDIVVTYALEAARRAKAVGAHREAAAQYARTLSAADSLSPTTRAAILEEAAREYAAVDQLTDAIQAGKDAITIWRTAGDRLRQSENESLLAMYLVSAGRNVEGEQANRAAIDILADLPEGLQHGRAYRVQASLHMLNGDYADAVAWGERAIGLAEPAGDTETLVAAYRAVGTALLLAGDEHGRDHLERSVCLARDAGFDEHAATALGNLASAYGERYQFRLADQYLTEAIAYCAERDLDRQHLYMLAWQALSCLHQGRWGEATEAAAAVLHHPSPAAISRIMALIARGRVRARRGDPEVWPALDEALALAAPTNALQRIAPVRAARAEAAWLAGDRDRTAAEARAAYDLAVELEHPWHAGELAYWLWKCGDLAACPPCAATPWALQIAGDVEVAAARWRELGCPYEAARALGDSNDEEVLKRAFDVFEGMGARPASMAISRRLRDQGARGILRGPRPSTRANPAGLTTRELEVLRLIAEGLRNAEIAHRLTLSAKTVDHHVSAVLGKLGARTRTEAARMAARLGRDSGSSE
jgi:DNA-binding CsgD family transcriptional regulator